MTTIYFVRHGQSQANLAQIMQGSLIDTPLTELGEKQALLARKKLADIHFDAVYSSPLKRANQTATIISSQKPKLDERLLEFDYGTWDGRPLAELYQNYPKYFDEYHNLLPNSWEVSSGQTYAEVTKKLDSFLNDIYQKYPTKTLLVVSHGFTLKLLASLLLEISDNKLQFLNEPDNASITKVKLSDNTRTLFYYGK